MVIFHTIPVGNECRNVGQHIRNPVSAHIFKSWGWELKQAPLQVQMVPAKHGKIQMLQSSRANMLGSGQIRHKSWRKHIHCDPAVHCTLVYKICPGGGDTSCSMSMPLHSQVSLGRMTFWSQPTFWRDFLTSFLPFQVHTCLCYFIQVASCSR